MNYTIIIAIIIFGIASIVFIEVSKRMRLKKIIHLLQSRQFEEFFELCDAKFTKFLFPIYNIEYMKLNAYILQENLKNIEAQFKKLLAFRMNKKQKEDMYMKAFNYYVGNEDAKNAKKMLTLIKKLDNDQIKHEASVMYDIFILKNDAHLQSMLADLKDLPDAVKGVSEYLISVQYANIKDKKNADKYLKLSKKHMDMPQN
ncbi:MAG: hypothetical protein ACK5KR_07355 [Breznakia sp.]